MEAGYHIQTKTVRFVPGSDESRSSNGEPARRSGQRHLGAVFPANHPDQCRDSTKNDDEECRRHLQCGLYSLHVAHNVKHFTVSSRVAL